MSERPPGGARIGLLGRGTVGSAFHDLLAERASAVETASGRRPEITGILRRSEGDFEQILAGSDVIVELIGGVEPAREYVLAALRAGRPVVTANKQLVAQHGDELFDAARDAGVQLRFEAAVAGAVPVIRMVQEGLGTIALDRISGIVNGTTNFILSEMASTGADYGDALARAQELGYAEADPTDDVGGADAAAKMAILARLAFHTPVSLEDVSYEGITEIRPADIAYARDLGLSLKLLGIAERRGEGISVRVFPCFLYRGHPLAPIEGSFNAITVEAPAITEITMSGPGAGGIETASAVLSDVVSILAGEAPVHLPGNRLEVVADLDSSFYLHLEVADRPGVLAAIADVLGRNGLSVKSVVQAGSGQDARLVMVTHRAPESDFYASLEEISGLDFLRAAPRAIRVVEEEYK
jgi:homoserine dehydrogenase